MNVGARAYASTQPAPDLDALVRKHAELVKRIAYHLAGRLPPQVEVEDLMQAGMMGLLEAAQNYATGRGASFETYAGIRIRGAMLDALRKLDWAPRSVHRKARAAAQALREVEALRGSEANEADVAAHMGVSLTEYQRIVQDTLSSGNAIPTSTGMMGGYPGADLVTAAGHDVPAKRTRSGYLGGVAGNGTIPAVRIAPGATASAMLGMACSSAWPVPNCSACKAHCTAACAKCSRSRSPPWP